MDSRPIEMIVNDQTTFVDIDKSSIVSDSEHNTDSTFKAWTCEKGPSSNQYNLRRSHLLV